MFESFAKYLLDKVKFTQSELELIKDASMSKRIRKNQYLLEEGQVSDFNGFVVKGSFRLFRVGEDGQEHILKFAIENWWISDYSSFMTGQIIWAIYGAPMALAGAGLVWWVNRARN